MRGGPSIDPVEVSRQSQAWIWFDSHRAQRVLIPFQSRVTRSYPRPAQKMGDSPVPKAQKVLGCEATTPVVVTYGMPCLSHSS
jgi:hypothetical protein